MKNKVMTAEPVLFVLIGWAQRYDGTEAIVGGHDYLQDNPAENAELEAFVRQDDGKFYCGAGKGELHEDWVDAVFIARHPETQAYEVVAVYLKAKPRIDKNRWCTLKATEAILLPVGKRPRCDDWPTGRGMRRWARRVKSKGSAHQKLLATYNIAVSGKARAEKRIAYDTDVELDAFEGELKRRFIVHRRRESALRAAKIRHALRHGNGFLRCEVPGCHFDFFKTYGNIGKNYAVVHHIKPLASLSSKGAKTSLADLAIVCANCHAMIHRGGQCRSIESLMRE